ncbi:MAG: RNA polymerase sigma factor [Candidatus Limnocylindrales bacterium]
MDPQRVVRAKEGDEEAFATIVETVYPRFRSVAYRILGDPSLAEDATQQALLRIWRKLPRLRDPARFEAWGYRFLVRACADEARRQQRSLPVVVATGELIAADDTHGVDDRDQLERGFQRLSLEQRTVIVLHHYLDLTLEDTATALGVPVGTVNSRLSRAMSKLRDTLERDSRSLRSTSLEATR